MMRHRLVPVLWVLFLMLCAGCTFNRAWKRSEVAPAPTQGFIGRWEGNWESDHNHHSGRLKCLVSKDAAGGYEAWFHAAYLGVFRASYKIALQASPRGGGFDLRGQKDLGWLAGGTYEYEGWADATNFFANYRSKHDHGTFHLTRP